MWECILGGATVFGLIVALGTWINGRMTRKVLTEHFERTWKIMDERFEVMDRRFEELLRRMDERFQELIRRHDELVEMLDMSWLGSMMSL